MDWWKILSLVITGVYIICAILSFCGEDSGKKPSAEDIFEAAGGMFFWLLISLGCIWYGDELGEGVIGAKFGLVSQASPGWAVAFIGWILLLLPGVLIIFFWLGN